MYLSVNCYEARIRLIFYETIGLEVTHVPSAMHSWLSEGLDVQNSATRRAGGYSRICRLQTAGVHYCC